MPKSALGFLNTILDPVLNPLLHIFSPFWFIVIITFLITLIVTLIYKYTTNQELVKRLRDEMKEIQKQMKEYKDDLERVKDLQKQSFEKMGVQFRQSMRPMIITMIPMIIILGWLAGNLSYESLKPMEEFNVEVEAKKLNLTIAINVPEGVEVLDGNEKQSNPQAKWSLRGAEGHYTIEFNLKDEKKIYTKEIIISKRGKYKDPISIIDDELIKQIKIGNKPMKILGLSWFWAYFILAIAFNSLLRKLLKVY